MWNPFRSIEQEMEERLSEAKNGYIPLADRRPKRLIRKALVFVLGICFVIFVWYLVALYYNAFMADMLDFPAPVETFERLNKFFTTNYKILGQNIAAHTKASLSRWIKGFAVAAVIGLTIGLLMGTSEKIHEFAMVPVNVLQLIPGLAWFPVTILLFGLNEKSAIFIIAITIISPIAISTANGLRKVPRVNMRVSQMSGRSKFETFSEVLIPFAAIDILSGLRIGIANGWRMLISAEMVVGVALGLGYAIQITTGYTDYASAFACIIIICIIGLLIDKIALEFLENYVRSKLGVGDE